MPATTRSTQGIYPFKGIRKGSREIYLKGFEIAIKESNPAMVMTAYNKLNGTYTSASSDLLNGILREEWEYNGLVTTDWDNLAEPIEEIKAGNNLRMPAGSNRRLKKALEENGYHKRPVKA